MIEKCTENKVLAKNVRKNRLNLGLTQEQLAEKVGTSTNHISKIERGYMPSLTVFIKLTSVLKVTPNDLLLDECPHSAINLIAIDNMLLDNVIEQLKNQSDKIDLANDKINVIYEILNKNT